MPSLFRVFFFRPSGRDPRRFCFVGLDIFHAVRLPAGPRAMQYRPGGQEQVDRVVANWAAIVKGLEGDLAPRLEAVYRNHPSWFPSILLGRGRAR